MARTIYGAELYKSPTKEVNFESGIIGANSEVFTVGDPVTISSGYLIVAGTTNQIIGIVAKTQTMSASNQTVAKVKPSYIPIDQDMEFLMGTNSDLAATSVGNYYDITTTTGTIQVDVASGVTTTSNRVVVITAVDPLNEGGTGAGSGLRQCLVKFVKIYNIRSDN